MVGVVGGLAEGRARIRPAKRVPRLDAGTAELEVAACVPHDPARGCPKHSPSPTDSRTAASAARDTIRETLPAFRVCRSTQRTGMGAYATSHAHAALCDGLLFAPRISGLE